MKRTVFAFVLLLSMSSAAQTATLTITPDRQVYQVGEQIVLNVFGDSEGAADRVVVGRILFDAALAEHVSSSQQALTSAGDVIAWAVGPLRGGDGFGDAFSQVCCDQFLLVDGPLIATVVLRATAPGTLDYSWQTDGPDINWDLHFFGLGTAPGGSVTIVPEPTTALLLVLGLIGLRLSRRVT